MGRHGDNSQDWSVSVVAPSVAAQPRRLASVAKAADYAACSPKTIRRRIADGTLTGYRMGPRLIRVDLDEVDAALRPIATAGRVVA